MTEPNIDLDKIDFGAGPAKEDPKPKTSRRNSTGNPVGRPSRENKIKELAEELKGFLFLANLGLMSRDVHEVYEGDTLIGYTSCLGVYVDIDKKGLPVLTPQGSAFVQAAANIIIDNSFLMKMLDGGDTLGKWMMLVMALQPLVISIISNHSFRRGVIDDVPAPVPGQ